MKKQPKLVRQGDVALQPVKTLPAGAVLLPGQERKVVLALGEATGHHHRVEHAPIEASAAAEMVEALIARCRLYEHKGDRFLVVDAPVDLQHEEHSTIALAPGVYELPVQVEYTTGLIRRVQD